MARVLDADLKMMQKVFEAAANHKGVAMVEIYFNCVTFNDGTFDLYANKKTRADHTVELVAGEPLIFGGEHKKGLRLKGLTIEVVDLDKVDKSELLVHRPDAPDSTQAYLLSQLRLPEAPVPLGIFRQVQAPTYGDMVSIQAQEARKRFGEGDILKLLRGSDSWKVD